MIEIQINSCKSSVKGIPRGRGFLRERGNKDTGGGGIVCADV